MEKLRKALSKYGTLQVMSSKKVFVLLITGAGLTKSSVVNEIQMKVLEFTQDKYPHIQVLKNEDTFYLMVLTP